MIMRFHLIRIQWQIWFHGIKTVQFYFDFFFAIKIKLTVLKELKRKSFSLLFSAGLSDRTE